MRLIDLTALVFMNFYFKQILKPQISIESVFVNTKTSNLN